MSPRRIWKRELAFRLVRLFERNDWPGAWRLRAWFERQDFVPRDVGPIACHTEYGFDIVLDPFGDRGVEQSILNTGAYEQGTIAVIEAVLKSGDRFIDIGANVGLMTLVAARVVGTAGRVDCFEPLPEIARLLSTSLKINRFDNVVLHVRALGSIPSTLTISRHPDVNRGSASFAWDGDQKHQASVRVETLDDCEVNSGARPAAMIKIDVEGWEFEVLKGARQTLFREPRPVICVEFSTTHPLHGGTASEMFGMMESYGYQGYCLAKTKSVPSALRKIDRASIPAHDNVFFFPAGSMHDFDPALFIAHNKGGR